MATVGGGGEKRKEKKKTEAGEKTEWWVRGEERCTLRVLPLVLCWPQCLSCKFESLANLPLHRTRLSQLNTVLREHDLEDDVLLFCSIYRINTLSWSEGESNEQIKMCECVCVIVCKLKIRFMSVWWW